MTCTRANELSVVKWVFYKFALPFHRPATVHCRCGGECVKASRLRLASDMLVGEARRIGPPGRLQFLSSCSGSGALVQRPSARLMEPPWRANFCRGDVGGVVWHLKRLLLLNPPRAVQNPFKAFPLTPSEQNSITAWLISQDLGG